MKKICIIYNFAQHYRASIFKLLDKEYNCDYYFGESYLDIKKMDYKLLNGNVKELKTIKIGPVIYRKGTLSLLHKEYNTYIVLGETRVLSVWLFAILGRLFYPRKKIYFWTHGWYGKEHGLSGALSKLFNKLPNGGLFLYGYYAKNLLVQEGFHEDKLFVIHNSLAYDEQLATRKVLNASPIFKKHFGNDCPVLVFVGRLTTIKKLDLLINALSINHKAGKDYNLVLIGGGEKSEDLKKLCDTLNVSNQVWFYGPCYDEQVLGNLIFNADLCVSPGNVGLTAMHTMVFGTPVLTHNNFAHQMPEHEAIIDGYTGAFFKENSITSLAEKINEWFENNGSDREQIRANCMKEIDDNWTPSFQLSVFKQVLGK